MASDGSINCLALAYLADNIPERQRASAFGILAGVAAVVSILAAVYMRVFLEESLPNGHGLRQPILKGEPDDIKYDDDRVQNTSQAFKRIPSIGDLICLMRSSVTFSQATVVSLFNSLADGGILATLLYFLKARFHFNKNQFADLMLILGVAGTISQLLFMPILAPVIGEQKLLSIGLLMGCTNMFFNSMAWSVWVPYACTVFSIFTVFVQPSLRSIVSKQVGPNEQLHLYSSRISQHFSFC
ncbi:hypothetical protein I3760_06G121500 [Carya illinoinensis]|nr:hypothetical protein I3760_06G121500 [Carya illinoinensis]